MGCRNLCLHCIWIHVLRIDLFYEEWRCMPDVGWLVDLSRISRSISSHWSRTSVKLMLWLDSSRIWVNCWICCWICNQLINYLFHWAILLLNQLTSELIWFFNQSIVDQSINHNSMNQLRLYFSFSRY